MIVLVCSCGKLCYLHDMLSVYGDADAAVEAIEYKMYQMNLCNLCLCLSINTDFSFLMRGKLSRSCMLPGSRTWLVKKEEFTFQ